MWWLLSVIMPCVAAWFVTKLMNSGDFDQTYFFASLSGALTFPFVATFLSWDFFGRAVDPTVFYNLQPRCAGAFIGCLVFEAVKSLRA
jgi:hypothetical protein